jgi:hypothetical protein
MTPDRPRLLLINPWIYDVAAYDFFARPLGLLYLAGWLEARGFSVHLIDCLAAPHARPGPFGTGRYPKKSCPRPRPWPAFPGATGATASPKPRSGPSWPPPPAPPPSWSPPS